MKNKIPRTFKSFITPEVKRTVLVIVICYKYYFMKYETLVLGLSSEKNVIWYFPENVEVLKTFRKEENLKENLK